MVSLYRLLRIPLPCSAFSPWGGLELVGRGIWPLPELSVSMATYPSPPTSKLELVQKDGLDPEDAGPASLWTHPAPPHLGMWQAVSCPYEALWGQSVEAPLGAWEVWRAGLAVTHRDQNSVPATGLIQHRHACCPLTDHPQPCMSH